MLANFSFFRGLTRFALTAVAVSLLTACGPGNAAALPGKDIEQVKKLLATKIPKAKVDSVSATPLAGIYEVVVDGENIFYVDAKVEYIFQGELISLKTKQSLTSAHFDELHKVTEARAAQERKNVAKAFPIESAIRVEKGNGKRVMYVFSDPDCPFCYRLEQTLKQIDNVTVYTFLFPLTQLHPDAARKAAMLWCAPDRAAAWTRWMDQPMQDWQARKGLPDNKGDCQTPLMDIAALGNRLGVQGTPAIFFPDGTMLPGAYPKEEIEKELNKQN
ncbi:DsbC family protein [Leeia oryzae]|uniref:DsbC family protein n=1 Tax=Leeia oryzae TaxID=356662 RepID=UPI0003657C86|nr:DsbC family protein [Leeia oryzae]